MIRHSLSMMNKIIMRRDHERDLHHEQLPPNSNLHNDVIIVPPSLRTEVLRVMHSTHQGVTAVN